MGTRADFYIGRNIATMEWIASIALDGYPEGIDSRILEASTPERFRACVQGQERRDLSLPVHGWPWPWETSSSTDYVYAFENGKVWASCFGDPWFDPLEEQPDYPFGTPAMPFPEMDQLKNVTFGERSGLIVLQGKDLL